MNLGVYVDRPIRFGGHLAPVPFFFFSISPFGMGVPVLCLSHHCILEAHNICDFTGSQLESHLFFFYFFNLFLFFLLEYNSFIICVSFCCTIK